MRLSIIMLALFVFSAGCKKDSTKELLVLDGFIHWGGSPALDGTGWSFYEEGYRPNLYFLKNLPPLYQIDEAPVHITIYRTNEKLSCFCSPLPPLYAVEKIRFR